MSCQGKKGSYIEKKKHKKDAVGLLGASGSAICYHNYHKYFDTLTIMTLWTYSADEKLIIFFLFFPEIGLWNFMQIVPLGDNFHEMSKPIFWEK